MTGGVNTASTRWRPGHAAPFPCPLTVNEATIGAVNLYSRVRNSFGASDIRRAESLTLQAATALTLLLRHAQQTGAGAAPPGDDLEELRQELDEARETLRTIRAGGFDALVINTGNGAGVFTPRAAERPYRLAEGLAQGAHTYFRAVASDFDGTMADGPVAPDTLAALAEARQGNPGDLGHRADHGRAARRVP